MNRKILFWPLAAMLLTACEKTLEVGEDVFPTEQVKNSLLQVPTRSGGSGDEATATLVDGGTNTITLGMTRKTMLIQSIEIKKVPTAATTVSVTLLRRPRGNRRPAVV